MKQSNTNALDEYRRNCLMKAVDHWKKWKSRIKKTYFIPNKDSPAKLKEPPNDNCIDTNQWNKLVSYWSNEDVEMLAEKNRKNRFELDVNHRLGRKSMARLRLEMEINNKDTSRANMFIKSRERKEGTPPEEIADEMIEQIKKKLNEVSEEEKTEEYKEKVYLDIVGPDKLSHERVRLYGYGPSLTVVFGASSSSSRECSSSSTIHTLKQFDTRMQDHEKRMAEDMERLGRRQREIEEELERRQKGMEEELQRRKMELEIEHPERKNEMNLMMDLLRQQLGVSGGVPFNLSPRQSPLHKSSVGTDASPVGDVHRELISSADAIIAHTKDKGKEVLPEEEMSEKSNEDK